MAAKIFDITPKISSRLAVFPGDQRFERRVSMALERGDHLELSSMLTTLHLGAHADAPSHYGRAGASIEKRPLGRYMGRAQVVRPQRHGGHRPRPPGPLKARLGVADLEGVSVRAPRVLIDTQSFTDPEVWSDDFMAFSPELLHHLADQGVTLVGIDTPSVDLADSKLLESHQVLLARDLAVLEGLLLKGVPEGVYTLIALPLPIEGGDASPVRAVLLPEIPGFPDL